MGSGKGGAAGRSPLKNRGTRKRSCGHKLYANLVDSGKEKSLLRGRGLRYSKNRGILGPKRTPFQLMTGTGMSELLGTSIPAASGKAAAGFTGPIRFAVEW